jgi:hypothetical protein
MGMIRIFFLILISSASVVSAVAQINVSTLTRKFEKYSDGWRRTSIHVFFNQKKYSPGDTAFFKAYYSYDDLTPVPDKQMLEVNVTDHRGETKMRFLFRVTDGVAYNQIIFPKDFESGFYRVNVYNNWDKNFDPSLVYSKELEIVTDKKIARLSSEIIKFGIQGGHLINNVNGRVAVISRTPLSRISIEDLTQKSIASETTDSLGTALLSFEPVPGEKYFLRANGGERLELPLSRPDGITYQAQADHDNLLLTVSSAKNSPYIGKKLFAILSASGKIIAAAAFIYDKSESQVKIPLQNFSGKIFQISILDESGEVLASGQSFFPLRFLPIVKIFTSQQVSCREDVSIEVEVSENGAPTMARFSIDVVNTDVVEDDAKDHALNETPDNFTGPLFYQQSATSLYNALTAYSSPLPWKEILAPQPLKPVFPMISFIEKSGVAYIADSHEVVPDFTQIMFYLQNDKMHYQTFTQNGKVALVLPEIFGPDEFFYVAETKGNEIQNLQIEWDEKPIALKAASSYAEQPDEDTYASFISKLRSIQRSYRYFHSEAVAKSESTTAGSFEEELVTADLAVDIQKYILFQSMEELIKEVIPSLFYRKAGGKNIVRVTLEQPMFATTDPVYIIDGIATKNTSFFLSLKPSELKTVKIIKSASKLKTLGLLGKNGIVIVETIKGNKREPVVDLGKLVYGFNPPINFRNIGEISNTNMHIPHFRTTLYWNPTIETEANGKAMVKFKASDDTGLMKVIVHGLTKDNKPFFKTATFNVVPGGK